MKKLFSEFGTFIAKGNAIDLAVGLVIGTAFNAIIKSLVNDIIMPLISLIGGKDVSNWFWVLKGSSVFDDITGEYVLSVDAVVLYYGRFIQSMIDFLIIAFAIFIALKVIIAFRKSIEDAKKLVINQANEKIE
ncbi:MAG: large conductance mechanosensitive channel protein MscL [Acholeplasmataceae bacterium]